MRQPQPFGKYLLLDRVSVGGMAEVFKAKSFGVEGFEKIIAIKRILPSMAEDEEFIEMFIDEAKIAGQLSHANVCQIFELGKIASSHFIAMEYVWGKDVLQIQNRFRKLARNMPVSMAAFVASRVCAGLHYAHKKKDAQGDSLEIIHRDISPQNVLVSYDGEIKLIDFGIAKATSRSSRTQAGVLKGKFGYMSPEQVRGLPMDRRSDLFSVGTIMYEMLTSSRLFISENDFSTLEKVKNVDIQPPSHFNPDIPPEFERIILKALARNPDERYQWASEIQEDLTAFLMSQEPIFTAKDLALWMKEAFAPELERERETLNRYKRLREDGSERDNTESRQSLAALDEEEDTHTSELRLLRPGQLGPAAQTHVPLEEPTHVADSGRRQASQAARSFQEEEGSTVVSEPGFGARPNRGGPHGFDEGPTEIFGEVAARSERDTDELRSEASETTVILDRPPHFGDGPPPRAATPTPVSSPPKFDLSADEPTEANKLAGRVASPPPVPLTGVGQAPMPAASGASSGAALEAGAPRVVVGAPVVVASSRPAFPSPPTLAVPLPVPTQRVTRDDLVWGGGAAAAALLLVLLGHWLLPGRTTLSAATVVETTGTLAIAAADLQPAEVFVNGARQGALVEGDVLTIENLPAGELDVAVRRAGVPDCKQRVTLIGGATKVVMCRFSAEAQVKSTLRLKNVVAGSTVFVNRQEISAAAAREPLVLTPGVPHEIRVVRDGFEPEAFSIELTQGEHAVRAVGLRPSRDVRTSPEPLKNVAELPGNPKTRKVEPPPPKATVGTGHLIVSTTPRGKLFVDGKDTGLSTPVGLSTKLPLSAGTHKISIRAGEETFDFPVEIRAGEVTRVNRTLGTARNDAPGPR